MFPDGSKDENGKKIDGTDPRNLTTGVLLRGKPVNMDEFRPIPQQICIEVLLKAISLSPSLLLDERAARTAAQEIVGLLPNFFVTPIQDGGLFVIHDHNKLLEKRNIEIIARAMSMQSPNMAVMVTHNKLYDFYTLSRDDMISLGWWHEEDVWEAADAGFFQDSSKRGTSPRDSSLSVAAALGLPPGVPASSLDINDTPRMFPEADPE